jgi:hypothetical protein
MRLEDLPLDLLTDALFPWLDVHSLLALSGTSKAFRAVILEAAALWKHRLINDLGFDRLEARTAGFYDLYRRVATSKPYVWGASGRGRLGLADSDLRSAIRRNPRHQGGVAVPTIVKLSATIVDIKAGGWSFVSRDATGKLW